MNTFSQHVSEDRRLAILLILAASAGYSANHFMLQDMLDAGYGHRASADLVRADFAWLAEQGLVDVADIAGVQIAKLSGRGLDVALGRVAHPGVKRPRPS